MPAPWVSEMEDAIRSLRGIDGVRIQTQGEEIRDIHILSSSQRPPRLIVRDIVALLSTRFHRTIDYRVVQVAFTVGNGGRGAPGAPAALESQSAEPQVPRDVGREATFAARRESPPSSAERGAARPETGPAANGAAGAGEFVAERIRFGSVNLKVEGRQVEAEVELRWKGVPRFGSAAASGTRESGLRLVAQATIQALQEFLGEEIAFSLDSVQVLRAGRRDVAVVALELLVHRAQKTLVGACTVEQDAEEAVALATLSALNRVVGGLLTREPTEYVLRPAAR